MSLAEQVHIDIDSFDKTVIYYDLKVELAMASHLTFSFLWRYTDMVITSRDQEDAMVRRYQARDVIFTFRGTPGIEAKAKGFITNVGMTDNQGGSVGLQITGMGHTRYIDDMKKSRTFLDRDLQYIVQEILPAETPGDFYQWADMVPTYKNRIPYSAQYNETTFGYLKRLATRYGQWFYWDGMRLQFGMIKAGTTKLISGSSVHEFTTATHLAPQKVSLAGYDYTQNTGIQASQRKVEGGSSDGLAAHLSQKQHDYFTRDMEVSAYTGQAAGKPELEDMAKLQAAAAATSIVTYSGVSYVPLWLGRSFMVLKGQIEYRLVTVSVKHLSDNHGNYRCEFTAVPEDVAAPPYTDPHCFAHAESQSAKVYDNNDPEGMGRIKVLFYWGIGGYNVTDWIRMVQPHSGAGKGFYFIPEIGEEVLVGFEGGNAEKPYVIGAHYNGKQSSGFHTPGNDLKVFTTRSGIENRSNDAERSWQQSTPDGNFLQFDGQGNATLNVPKDLTINVGDNFNINVGKNISFRVGLKAIYNIGVQMMMNTPILRYLIADNYHLQSPKTLINGDGEIKIEAKETNVAGTQKLFMHSNETATINSKGTVYVKGQDGTNHTNVAQTVTFTEILLDATCIVQFRPKSNWKGEFGFDWFRIGDTGLDGDTNYDTLIGQYYTKAITDPTTTRNTNSNKWTTFFQLDPQPTAFSSYNKLETLKNLYGNYRYSLENDASGNPVRKRYYRPYITLFPRTPDPANPRRFTETGEARLELYLEFQKINGQEVKPDRVVFEVDGRLADNSHTLISIDKHTIQKGRLRSKIGIKLTCNSSFTSDKDINVVAVMLDENGNERSRAAAGVLKIIAPSKQLQKDIVIVKVRTRFGSRGDSGLSEFTRNLRQALILPNIVEKVRDSLGSMEDISIDVRNSANNHLNIDFNTEFGVTAGNIVNKDGNSINLDDYLKAELERKYPGRFTNHFKLFFLKETCDFVSTPLPDGRTSEASTLGYSRRNTDFGIMFGNHDASTVGHECLHGLGLSHSFYGTDYIYKALKTDNVMDYSHLERDEVNNQQSTKLDRVSTWYWQWDKVNPNIN